MSGEEQPESTEEEDFEPKELPRLAEVVEDLEVGLENMRRVIDETGSKIVVLKREDGNIVRIHAFSPGFLESLSPEETE